MTLDERITKLERRVTWLIAIVTVLACLVIVREARSQEIGKAVTTTAEAVGWALGDLATLPEIDRPFQRFVWLPPWADSKWLVSVNFAVNTAASHATTIQLGTPIANGWMLRYDLRRLAPSQKQFETLRSVWDSLAQQDPYFHIPATTTGLAAAVIAPHLSQEQALALAGLSLSTGAVYRADFLLVKMLSTLEGGKYYDFLQIPQAKEGSTQQAAWLATLGIFERTAKDLNAEMRSAIFRSNVTGKPRLIVVLWGIGRGGTVAFITFDIGDEDIAAEQHPIRNLLAFQDRAREIIVQRPNGLHVFALTNASGQIQNSAPDNVVRDHTIPTPHTSRLQPAISCIRCHGPHDGLQPFGNDVQRLLASNVDVFADLAGGFLTREQIVDKLAGLYAGQLDIPEGPIGRARRDYIYAVSRLVGDVDMGEGSVVTNVSQHISQVFASYRYDMVTPERACLELGLEVAPGEGIVGLSHLLGTISTKQGIVDPFVASLRTGIALNRFEFEQIFVDMSIQAESRRARKQ